MNKKTILACTVCLSRNYTTTKGSDEQNRLEMKKFCRHCNKHTVHKETK